MTPLPRCLLAAGLFATSPALYATSGSFACKVAGCTYPSRRKDDEMKIAEVRVSGCRCETVRLEPIPRGIVGAVVAVEYTDPAWDSLRKTVVFRGAATKDVLDAGNEIVIPAEVVSKAGGSLYMGVYGVDAENHVAIPTIWTELGVIQGAATPSGDASTAPSLPVWAQIQAMVGDLGTLDTEAKSNLVAAINEALTTGGEIAPAEVQRIVENYLKANPPGTVSDGKDGITPTIGKNGNWYLGSTDTGKPSRGADGTPGVTGAPGKDGAPGADGKDGITPTIGKNGNWYLGSTDTGKPSRGAGGTPGAAGASGKDGSPGADGKDGITPAIGENGNWYLGNTDTGKPSRGENGAVPDIQIGTVTTLPAGSDATASMGGTAENPLLNLGIPRGADGQGGGSGGTDISLGLTSATVGQTIKVKAVDTDGKPTAWEAAESGEKWEKIAEIIIPDDAEESNALTINKDHQRAALFPPESEALRKIPQVYRWEYHSERHALPCSTGKPPVIPARQFIRPFGLRSKLPVWWESSMRWMFPEYR